MAKPAVIDKHCLHCDQYKPISNFRPHPKYPDGVHPWCKRCLRNEEIRLRSKNLSEKVGKIIPLRPKSSIRVRDTSREQWYALAQSLGYNKCWLCGYDRCWKAIDFHHINPLKKNCNISQWVQSNPFTALNEKRFRSELRNCITLCSNCHRELHGNFFSLINSQLNGGNMEETKC